MTYCHMASVVYISRVLPSSDRRLTASYPEAKQESFQMPKVNLTDEFVANAKTKPGKDRIIYWDTNLRRFGLAVT